jgi:hypothetical protein
LPGTFQAENFDEGGQFVAYYDTSSGNKGGVYRAADVDLASTADAGGGYYVGWTKAGEWLKYTVNVTTAGTYPLETRLANLGTGGKFHVEVDGVDKTGPLAIPNTGSWDTYQTFSTPAISFTAGQHVIRVVFDAAGTGGGVGNYNWFRISASSPPPPPPPPPPPGNTPYSGTAVSLPGVVQAENYDNGGQNVAYYDTTSTNSGGAYRTAEGVDVAATTDPGNAGYFVGWARVGEWLKYTVNATQTRNYTLNIRIANAGTGATFRVEVDGVDRTGAIAVPNTGDWDTWQTISISGIPLTQGQRVIRVVMLTANTQNNSVGNFGFFSFQ